jgi:hypothetical protein
VDGLLFQVGPTATFFPLSLFHWNKRWKIFRFACFPSINNLSFHIPLNQTMCKFLYYVMFLLTELKLRNHDLPIWWGNYKLIMPYNTLIISIKLTHDLVGLIVDTDIIKWGVLEPHLFVCLMCRNIKCRWSWLGKCLVLIGQMSSLGINVEHAMPFVGNTRIRTHCIWFKKPLVYFSIHPE